MAESACELSWRPRVDPVIRQAGAAARLPSGRIKDDQVDTLISCMSGQLRPPAGSAGKANEAGWRPRSRRRLAGAQSAHCARP